jgi:hypothetical protein
VIDQQGVVYAILWQYDPKTSRGPSMEILPLPEKIRDEGLQPGLSSGTGGIVDLPTHHFGMVFQKTYLDEYIFFSSYRI